MKLEGSGCDTVGRAVASDTRGNPNPVIGKLKKRPGKVQLKRLVIWQTLRSHCF